MLPPSPMLTIKNRGGSDLAGGRENNTLISSNVCRLVLLLALLAGCTPSGPRALLEGKRLIDEGKYPQAIEKLKTATSLLGGTNALAWNYLGVAYQHAGEDGRGRVGLPASAGAEPRSERGPLQSRLPVAGAKQA